MAKLYEFPKEKRVNRIYDFDYCKGCNIPIDQNEEFTVVIMSNGTNEKHIALCDRCAEEAKKHGII